MAIGAPAPRRQQKLHHDASNGSMTTEVQLGIEQRDDIYMSWVVHGHSVYSIAAFICLLCPLQHLVYSFSAHIFRYCRW